MAYQPQYYQGGYYPQYQNGAVPDMLGQYKGAYQPMQNTQMQVPQQMPVQQMMPSNDMIWVLSEVEAQSYPVAPNNSVTLWDKNNDVVYIKSANAQGVPSIRIFDYVERLPDNTQKRTQEHKCTCGDRFIPKEKFDELEAKFDELRAKVESLEKPKIMPKNKKVEENNDGE
jgi:hypothetical protein